MSEVSGDKMLLMVGHFVTIMREVSDDLVRRGGQHPFDQGYRFGMHHAGELLLECLRVFEVPASLVGADKLDPDRLLS